MLVRKIKTILVLMLLLSSLPIYSNAERTPVGVAGYVYDEDGHPIPFITVNVTNVNTTETKQVVTNADGLYAVSILAQDGDIIQANATQNESFGIAQGVVNTTKLTQWLNISFGGLIPPICNFYFEPTDPRTSDEVRFFEEAYDPDGIIVEHKWDFGDFSISNEENPEHVYTAEGTYKVTLMVKDNDGLWASCSKWITVSDEGWDEDNDTIYVPPLPPPIYPYTPYTIPEMYQMLKIDKLGKTNGNVKVAVIDTGVTQRMYNGYNMYLIKALKHPDMYDPYDNNGHGTWTNFAVFYGVYSFTKGEQYSIKVIEENSCPIQYLLEALDTCKRMKVDIVSISLGGGGHIGDAIDKKIRELRRDGIIVICAGGNYGPMPSTIISPALSPSAIAVGAVDPMRTLEYYKDDQICVWSSRGGVRGLREVKPDVVAGGESIIGPYLRGEKVASGTSMATPIVAGGCSVVYAKHERMWDFLKKEYFFWKGIVPFIFEWSLEKSCYSKGDGNIYGHGIPQFDKMESKAVALGLLFLILPFIIIPIIIFLIWYIRKKKGKKPFFKKNEGISKPTKPVKSTKTIYIG